jgi:hypothetical protein
MTRSLSTTMKLTAVTFLTLLTIATATSAFAQQQKVLRGNIPFNFTVGEKALPAGEYIVVPEDKYLLKIQSPNGRNWAVVAGSQSYHDASGGSRLEFDRIGESYFLHRVLCPSVLSLNIDVATGRSEKAARERQASLQSTPQVLVAMK